MPMGGPNCKPIDMGLLGRGPDPHDDPPAKRRPERYRGPPMTLYALDQTAQAIIMR